MQRLTWYALMLCYSRHLIELCSTKTSQLVVAEVVTEEIVALTVNCSIGIGIGGCFAGCGRGNALDSRRIVSDIKVLCVRGTGVVVIIIA